MCKISVILPSLNVADYISECLQSVREQTLENMEIICVDAGSTDGTQEIIKEYASFDGRIKFIHSAQKSYGYQLNVGIAAASGKYIGIVETDDFIPPQMYEDLCQIADREGAEIVKADFYRFKEDAEGYRCRYFALDPMHRHYNRLFDPAEVPDVFDMAMNTWSGIYLKDFLLENGIRHNETAGASFQDNGFWFQTFCCARKVYLLNRPYYMNRRDNAGSSVFSTGKVYCMTNEWRFIYNWLKSHPEKFEHFIGSYTVCYYRNLLTTWYRIAPEYREEFADHFSREMNLLYSSGEYRQKSFLAYEWKDFKEIRDNPQRWNITHLSGCNYYGLAKEMKSGSVLSYMVRPVDRLLYSTRVFSSWVRRYGLAGAVRRSRNKIRSKYIRKEEMHAGYNSRHPGI